MIRTYSKAIAMPCLVMDSARRWTCGRSERPIVACTSLVSISICVYCAHYGVCSSMDNPERLEPADLTVQCDEMCLVLSCPRPSETKTGSTGSHVWPCMHKLRCRRARTNLSRARETRQGSKPNHGGRISNNQSLVWEIVLAAWVRLVTRTCSQATSCTATHVIQSIIVDQRSKYPRTA